MKSVRAMVVAASAILLAISTAASAHHSFAMFDNTQTTVLEGTVKDYSLENPHSYLDIVVLTKSGRTQAWSIELHSVLVLRHERIGPTTFKPGDKVTVTINPLRNGTTGGALVSAVLANGETVGAATP